ncbi:unnamed protein product, partial [marine sediment metagenome]
TAVDKVSKGKGRTVNARFMVMCSHYLFDPALSKASPKRSKRVVLRFLDILPSALPRLDLGLGHQGAVLQAV